MADPANGMQAAVAAAMAETVEEPEAVQALLPLLPADEVAALPLDPVARAAALRAPRGPGRPKGAMNKRTAKIRDAILSRHTHPLEFLAQVWSRPTRDLATELECKPIEALSIQRAAAAEALPYLEGKMPVEVAVRGELMPFVMADAVVLAAALGNEENQPFSVIDLMPVGQPELDNCAETEADQASPAAAPLIADQRAEGAADAEEGSEGDR
ncbi:MAG: hypothetical protein AB7D00_03585 [Rhodospirillaceae bacterium]